MFKEISPEHQEPFYLQRTGLSIKNSDSNWHYDSTVNWFKNHPFFGPVILAAIISSFLIGLVAVTQTALNPSSPPKHNTIQSTCTDFSFYEWAKKYHGLTDVDAKRSFKDQDKNREVCGTFKVKNVSLDDNDHTIVSLADLEESEIAFFLEVEFHNGKGISLKIGEKIYLSGNLFNVQKDRSPVKPQELITVFRVKGSYFEKKITDRLS